MQRGGQGALRERLVRMLVLKNRAKAITNRETDLVIKNWGKSH